MKCPCSPWIKCTCNKEPKHQRGFDKEVEVNITSKSRSNNNTIGVRGRRMENEEKNELIRLFLHGEWCDTPLWPYWRMNNGNDPSGVKEVRRGEDFSENGPFFTSRGVEVRVSILREWTLRRSRTCCHLTSLRPWRMRLKGCDNP